MPAKRRLTMRQLRQMLRLAGSGTSSREIAVMLGVARSTVQDNLKRAAMAGLTWPLPGELTDDALEHRLFARAGVKQGQRRRQEPDWAELSIELKKPGVTLLILWEEYRSVHPDGYGYSRFCELFRGFEQRLSPTMRQEHAAGDKAFVDYSGKRVPIIDRKTGEVREAELFVGVLGASSYTFAEATWTQTLPDWIGSHVRMFAFFGGVPRLIVPDNLKSGVNRASFHDPEINRSYGMMASHYGVGVLPARPRRPKDKAKVENAVRFAQSCILGRLRKQTFFSLAEANAAIAEVLARINDHVMRRLGVSRRHLFETVERPALASLPIEDYEFAEWRLARGLDGLPRRVQELLLFRPACPHPPAGRYPGNRPDDRDIPSRQTRCCASAPLWRAALWNRPRSHAELSPPLRRMDAGALPALGRVHRSADRRADHRHPRQPAASGTRFQNMPRHPAPLSRHRP
jgi:transposase